MVPEPSETETEETEVTSMEQETQETGSTTELETTMMVAPSETTVEEMESSSYGQFCSNHFGEEEIKSFLLHIYSPNKISHEKSFKWTKLMVGKRFQKFEIFMQFSG